MRFIGVDTSSSCASVAITENGRLVTEIAYPSEATDSTSALLSRNNHAEVLLSLIDSTLSAAGFSVDSISGFAVASGPGSFTGLRIGLSTIKGLSYGSGMPLIGVSTLHACAARVCDFNGQICAILDARKRELYGALFHRHDGLLERITNDAVMSLEKFVDVLRGAFSSEPILLTGDGVRQYGKPLFQALGKQILLRENRKMLTTAAAIALLGEASFTRGRGTFRSSFSLHYLRPHEAEAAVPKLP